MFYGRVNRFAAMAAVAMVGLITTPTYAQYPDKPIRLIVTFVPGGGADMLGRYIGQAVGEELGQTVIVENRPGAGGMIGIDAGRAAAPDGYTLTLISSSYTVNPSLYTMRFDPLEGITPIVQVSQGPLLVVTNPKLPVNSIAELIEHAKQNPGKLNYASSGQGSVIHLANELFNRNAGVQMTHIPYKGGGNAQNDLMAGVIDVYFAATASALPHVQAGKMKALAVTTPERITALPDIPTIAESGMPGYEATLWYGLIGPEGMPPDVVEKINVAVNKALLTPRAKEKLHIDGAEPAGGTAEQFKQTIASEIEHWKKVVGELNISVE